MYTTGADPSTGGSDLRQVITDQQAQLAALQQEVDTLRRANEGLQQELAAAQKRVAAPAPAPRTGPSTEEVAKQVWTGCAL
jgi:hypothetical protein